LSPTEAQGLPVENKLPGRRLGIVLFPSSAKFSSSANPNPIAVRGAARSVPCPLIGRDTSEESPATSTGVSKFMKQTDKARSNNLVVDIVAVITLPEEYIVEIDEEVEDC
jgi:hypothetical protein